MLYKKEQKLNRPLVQLQFQLELVESEKKTVKTTDPMCKMHFILQ